MGYKSWIYLKKYATRIFHKRCKVNIVSDNLSLIQLRSFKFTNFILQEESWYSFQSKREQKRSCTLYKKTSIYRVILYLIRIETKSCNFLSAREQIATKIMGRQHVSKRNSLSWLTSHPAVISWKITFPWLLCILSMTKKPIERKVRSNTHTVKNHLRNEAFSYKISIGLIKHTTTVD